MEKTSENSVAPTESRKSSGKEYEPRGPLVHIDGRDPMYFGFDLEADAAERFHQVREMAMFRFGMRRRRKFK